MIPDFKTYIGESVWGDVRRRAEGQTGRKEDDINILDFDQFYDYLLARYDFEDPQFGIEKFPEDGIINLTMFENTDEFRVYRVIIWNFYNKARITIPRKKPFINSNFFNKIREHYKLIESGEDLNPLYTVEPKEGEVNNKFFIEFMDFIIDNIEPPYEPYITRKVNESVWGDVRRRAEGQTQRKEDDIDLMDKDRLWDYLREDLYEQTTTIYDIRFLTFPYEIILVPISINGSYSSSSVSYVGLEGFDSPKGMVVTIDKRSFYRFPEGVETELKEKYSLKYIAETSKRQGYVKITPKDGSPVTNSFYIEIIDFLLDNIRDDYNRLVRKK